MNEYFIKYKTWDTSEITKINTVVIIAENAVKAVDLLKKEIETRLIKIQVVEIKKISTLKG